VIVVVVIVVVVVVEVVVIEVVEVVVVVIVLVIIVAVVVVIRGANDNERNICFRGANDWGAYGRDTNGRPATVTL